MSLQRLIQEHSPNDLLNVAYNEYMNGDRRDNSWFPYMSLHWLIQEHSPNDLSNVAFNEYLNGDRKTTHGSLILNYSTKN